MPRLRLEFFVAAFAICAASAGAQDDALAGVTMRVLDDLSGLDAVILELDAARTADDEPAQPAEADAERAAEPSDAPAPPQNAERPAEPQPQPQAP